MLLSKWHLNFSQFLAILESIHTDCWSHRPSGFIIIMIRTKIKFCNLLKFAFVVIERHLITYPLVSVITIRFKPPLSPMLLLWREYMSMSSSWNYFLVSISNTLPLFEYSFTCNHDNCVCIHTHTYLPLTLLVKKFPFLCSSKPIFLRKVLNIILPLLHVNYESPLNVPSVRTSN